MYVVYLVLRELFVIFYLRKKGKHIELTPFDEHITTPEIGVKRHALLFKSPQFISEKNKNGIVQCRHTKDNRKEELYYDLTKSYSLKYHTNKRGKTYVMLDKTIFFLVCREFFLLLFGLIPLGVGLLELRKIIYMILM